MFACDACVIRSPAKQLLAHRKFPACPCPHRHLPAPLGEMDPTPRDSHGRPESPEMAAAAEAGPGVPASARQSPSPSGSEHSADGERCVCRPAGLVNVRDAGVVPCWAGPPGRARAESPRVAGQGVGGCLILPRLAAPPSHADCCVLHMLLVAAVSDTASASRRRRKNRGSGGRRHRPRRARSDSQSSTPDDLAREPGGFPPCPRLGLAAPVARFHGHG